MKRGKIPIVVGGTHYYIQSLLWKESLVKDIQKAMGTSTQKRLDSDTKSRLEKILERDIPVEILDELKRVDPVIADRWHPNDTRKIRRSLQVYLETGIKHSDQILFQKQTAPDCRWPTVIFWVYSPLEPLVPRLESRVDHMLKRGLLEELMDLKRLTFDRKEAGFYKPDGQLDFTRGLYQAIGFKEFMPYFHLSDDEDSSKRECVWNESVDMMKIATRAYAKKQVSWLKHKFIPHCRDSSTPHYVLDATNVDQPTWNLNVFEKARDILRVYCSDPSAVPKSESTSNLAAHVLEQIPQKQFDMSRFSKQVCDLCDVEFHERTAFEQHIRSRRHKKVVALSKSDRWPEIQEKQRQKKKQRQSATTDAATRT